MEDRAGAKPDILPATSVLYSQALRSLMGGECLQILRCSICMEFFNIPIVLPCGHTFCLQCLTEMCRHATQNRAQNPLKDLLIGCPNCRVQIFAKPILERNVTCNFIIQSLIDMLRNRRTPISNDACVNTDRSVVGTPVRSVNPEVLCGVLKDVDRLTSTLASRSIVDDAFFEIESLRRQYANSVPVRASSPEPAAAAATSGPVAGSGGRVPAPSRGAVTIPSAASPLTPPLPPPLLSHHNHSLTTNFSSVPPQQTQTHPQRKAYSVAVTSQPHPHGAARSTHVPPGPPPNACRPGFRNKNRNNADLSGGSPPGVATTPGDGAHCIAKILPQVTATTSRRYWNSCSTTGTGPENEPRVIQIRDTSLTVSGLNCLGGGVHSDDEVNASSPTITITKRLSRKRKTELQSARSHYRRARQAVAGCRESQSASLQDVSELLVKATPLQNQADTADRGSVAGGGLFVFADVACGKETQIGVDGSLRS